MALPGAPHTFALENCRDLLSKLEWEIEQLESYIERPDPGSDISAELISHVDALKYGAFNCAVTAWSLSDWVFEDLKSEKRKPKPTLDKFQSHCRAECEALRYCYLIANGSKHGGLKRKQEIEPEVGHDGNRWRVTITDGDQQHEALTVFNQAVEFWTQKIYGEKIGE